MLFKMFLDPEITIVPKQQPHLVRNDRIVISTATLRIVVTIIGEVEPVGLVATFLKMTPPFTPMFISFAIYL